MELYQLNYLSYQESTSTKCCSSCSYYTADSSDPSIIWFTNYTSNSEPYNPSRFWREYKLYIKRKHQRNIRQSVTPTAIINTESRAYRNYSDSQNCRPDTGKLTPGIYFNRLIEIHLCTFRYE